MQNIPFASILKDFLSAYSKRAYPSNFRQSLYYVHPDEKLFEYNFRHDVTRSDCPTVATGAYLIMDFEVPKGQYWIIKGFVPYAMERTDAGDFTESARYIQPTDGNGWFSFQPLAAGESPIIIQTNVNAPTNIGAAGLDTGMRQKTNGITDISANPRDDALRMMGNPFYTMAVKSQQRFQTVFSLLGPAPVGAGIAIANPYVVGTPAPPANKRVDFAGVCVCGVMLSEAAYRDVAKLFDKEQG